MSEPALCLPAEWEAQSGLLLTWPHGGTDFHETLDAVDRVFVELSRHTSRHQLLVIACHDTAHKNHVDALLQHHAIPAHRYRLFIAPSNDIWARDHGPITVMREGKPCLLDFIFNGWGGKYPAGLDNRITTRLHKTNAFGATPVESIDFVLEGGSIETDGQGTLLTTTSCLLSASRNRAHTRKQIESALARYLGAKRILWFEHGHLQGDDTDGHIDNLIRFVNADTLVYTSCKDSHHPDFASLGRMEAELGSLPKDNGKPYHLVALPLPVVLDDNHQRLPASYANFLIINDAVLVPVYDVPADEVALDVLAECFAGRSIIGIDCRPLIKQYGSLHCVTMQLPEGVLM
ncbi:MAG: agmatine deiminase [Gammaproteobacteria bacterium RBG_16_51_14]|nr:MAG: agmatine deiminase [Gammaproteobacteria bacterium RBG_16_51_14]